MRLHLTKTGSLAHLSHIEYMKAITRALRRADWPLVYSQGYHPKPKISFGPACPVGCESFAEWVDIKFHSDGRTSELIDRLRRSLPENIELISGVRLPEDSDNIMKEAQIVRYRVQARKEIPVASASKRAEALMQRSDWKLTREVKGKTKTVDVRSTILNLEVQRPDMFTEAVFDIALDNYSSARPIEIAREIFSSTDVRVVREDIVFRPNECEHTPQGCKFRKS